VGSAFIEEIRMKFINADNLHRKSLDMGHPSFVPATLAPRDHFPVVFPKGVGHNPVGNQNDVL
jgi:hypothetical protein